MALAVTDAKTNAEKVGVWKSFKSTISNAKNIPPSGELKTAEITAPAPAAVKILRRASDSPKILPILLDKPPLHAHDAEPERRLPASEAFRDAWHSRRHAACDHPRCRRLFRHEGGPLS